MIKTLFRGFKDAGSYDNFGWAVCTIIICFMFTMLNGFGLYWGLYFFSPLYGEQLLFVGWMAGILTPFYWIGKWLFYLGQVQRGTFDQKKEWKLFKRKSKPKEIQPGEDALNFIQGIRGER